MALTKIGSRTCESYPLSNLDKGIHCSRHTLFEGIHCSSLIANILHIYLSKALFVDQMNQDNYCNLIS